MSKYTFTCEHWDGSKITLEKESDVLSEVLESFEFFLKGAGFYLEGQIDVVNNEIEEFVNYNKDEEQYPFDFGAAQPSYEIDTSDSITLDITSEPALDLFSEYQEDTSNWPFPDKNNESEANAILHIRV